VAFAPRYATLADAEHRRTQDLDALRDALLADPGARQEAARAIAARQVSIQAWLARLEAESRDATTLAARRTASDRRLLLLAEASTLQLQADLARGAAARPTRDGADRDRFSVGVDLIVAPGDTVRHALAVGGDLRVEGTLTGDAIALGGRVVIAPHGVVEGRALGTAPGEGPAPRALVLALAAYAGLVPLALSTLAAGWVRDAGDHLLQRPLASARAGLGVTLGLSAWGLAALGEPKAAPLAAAMGGALIALASLGLAALAQVAQGGRSWRSAAALGAIVAATPLLPTPVIALAAMGALPPIGAVTLTGWERLRRGPPRPPDGGWAGRGPAPRREAPTSGPRR
jgi:hypothetical protein